MKFKARSGRVLGTLLFLLWLYGGTAPAEPLQEYPAELSLENLLAQARIREGLPALPRDLQADRTAGLYAEEMALSGTLSHRDRRGRNAAQRFAWTGRLVTLGEILGAAEELEALVPAWLDSPGHRDILLSRRWHSWGIGVAKAGKVWVAVVLFLEGGAPSGHSGS